MSWKLPSSPDAQAYAEALADIAATPDQATRDERLRALVLADFYAALKLVFSFGKLEIKDPGHKHRGRLWIDEPWIFDRAREIQSDLESRADDTFYNWPRFYFKTELITKDRTIWETLDDPSLTTAILTHKVDQVGEQMFSGITGELEENLELQRLFPAILRPNTQEYPLWTTTAATVMRPPGPKEPTFSIHGIDNVPTGGHYRRIVVDDAVARKTIENVKSIKKTEAQMRRVGPLGHDDTLTSWVGTIWDADDPYMQWIREGVFNRVSRQTAYSHPAGLSWASGMNTEDWTPVLRSRGFLDTWRRKMGEYEFSCQMMQQPVARTDQTFSPGWIQRYAKRPKAQAEGMKCHLFIDPAGEEGRESDYWVFRVTAFGADRNFYQLDLWRERVTLVEAFDLIFALVRYWRPEVTWLEEFGASSFLGSLRQAMQSRSYSFRLKKLPSIKRAKESRIQVLQVSYEQGRVHYPADGFGHGSGPLFVDKLRVAAGDPTIKDRELRTKVANATDTFDQFFREEYTRWVPVKGATLYDDMLDCEAYLVQEEMRTALPWPETPQDQTEPGVIESHPRGGNTGFSQISGWAF